MYTPLLLLLFTLPTVVVDRDNVEIRQSCRLDIRGPIVDADGNGVIHVTGDAIVIDGADQLLRGATPEQAPERYRGYGVRIQARRVTLKNLRVSGFKGGIYASDAHGLRIIGCDVSDNFRQKLTSTPEQEDLDDWLYPHHNDQNEWLNKWGAGIYIEESRKVEVRDCYARRGQNGLCLREVHDSRIFDNDFSYLSGWGVALYRSSDNVISRNALDFCIRGYSHGRYSRGQDSAGILLFEQCSRNVIGYNTATHGGDGFFGFGGESALQGKDAAAGVGCNANVIFGNDFSDAAANAIEITFSFDNVIVNNQLHRSHYGLWGGYSSRCIAVNNDIHENTIAGVAVEHGHAWQIRRNAFERNRRGVQLWWDDDKDLLAKPWSKVNPTDAKDHVIADNAFARDQVAIELRGGATATGRENQFREVDVETDVDTASRWETVAQVPRVMPLVPQVPGTRSPKANPALAGREHIVMTAYGPYPHDGSPFVRRRIEGDGTHRFEAFGKDPLMVVRQTGDVAYDRFAGDRTGIVLRATESGTLTPYSLQLRQGDQAFAFEGLLGTATWEVVHFNSPVDPREDLAGWQRAAADGVRYQRANLELPFRNYGPGRVPGMPASVREAGIGSDHFGTLAETEVRLPPGRWQIETISDDGIRVWVDNNLLIDNWTHHGPTRDAGTVDLTEARTVPIRVAHFELDGYALLQVRLRPAPR